jgi:hypothetical protein
MKTSHFIYALIAILLFASCGNSTSETQYDEFGNENFENYEQNEFAKNGGGYQQNNQGNQQNNQGYQNGNQRTQQVNYQQNGQQGNYNNASSNGGKKGYLLKDPSTGATVATFPIPSSWQPTSGDKQTYLKGPNGLKIYTDMSNFFYYSNDSGFNQFMKESGNQVKPQMTIDQLINQELVPNAKKEGARMINKYPVQQLAETDRRIDAMYYKSTPEQANFQAMVTEWEDNNGTKSVIVIKHKVSNYGQGRIGWGYSYSAMEVNASVFEQAKQDFLYALANIKMNPQYVQMTNQKNQQASQQFMAGHQQRMNNIKSFGEQNTRNFNARSAANDARNASWSAGQASSDRMQRNTINSINEVSTYQDQSGNTYQVDGYHNQVYTNGSEVITTDDYNYNPNGDLNVNGANWEQLDATDDGWN